MALPLGLHPKEVIYFCLSVIYVAACYHGYLGEAVDKTYVRDQYIFLNAAFVAIGVYAWKRISPPKSLPSDEASVVDANTYDPGIMNRAQTEEWKGWMQYMFLSYHYLNAKEAYPIIRVLVSAYVFLTGYGNLLFFKKSGDYSLKRVFGMLWRLNFSCVALMLITGNPYMLYYIVALHSFHFFFVYATMRVYSEWNNSARFLLLKFAIGGVLIFCVWDLDLVLGCEDYPIFRYVFAPLSYPLSLNGSLHEWHFRSGLDHYSSLVGAFVAILLPKWQEAMRKLDRLPMERRWLVRTGLVTGVIAVWVWWVTFAFGRDKYAYNAVHPYISGLPILGYILLRNITLGLRQAYSPIFQAIGLTTLETYILQFHIWLAADAKKMLVVLSGGYFLTNMLLLGLAYYVCSVVWFNFTLHSKWRTTKWVIKLISTL